MTLNLSFYVILWQKPWRHKLFRYQFNTTEGGFKSNQLELDFPVLQSLWGMASSRLFEFYLAQDQTLGGVTISLIRHKMLLKPVKMLYGILLRCIFLFSESKGYFWYKITIFWKCYDTKFLLLIYNDYFHFRFLTVIIKW